MADEPTSPEEPKPSPKRDEKGRFPKGVSGNISGRSQTQQEFKEAARDAASRAFSLKLKHVDAALQLDDDNRSEGANALRHIASRDAKEIIEQAYGKPTISLDATIKAEGGDSISRALDALAARLEAKP